MFGGELVEFPGIAGLLQIVHRAILARESHVMPKLISAAIRDPLAVIPAILLGALVFALVANFPLPGTLVGITILAVSLLVLRALIRSPKG